MAKEVLRAGLILLPPEEDHWVLGSGLASERFGAGDINPAGDWTQWKPADEEQKQFGFETMNCSNFATIKAWIALAKFLGFTDFMQDASERYTGVHTDTGPSGNDPHLVAEVIRGDCGLVPQAVMPWYEEVDSWEEYYDRKMAMSLLPLGKKLLERFEFGHEWVFPWGTSITPKQKAQKIREAVKRGAVALSVRAWKKKGGVYIKEKGEKDTHWVFFLRYEGDNAVIHDQYPPFEKKLAKDYDFNAAKVYFLKRKEQVTKRTFWDVIWDNFTTLWNR